MIRNIVPLTPRFGLGWWCSQTSCIGHASWDIPQSQGNPLILQSFSTCAFPSHCSILIFSFFFSYYREWFSSLCWWASSWSLRWLQPLHAEVVFLWGTEVAEATSQHELLPRKQRRCKGEAREDAKRHSGDLEETLLCLFRGPDSKLWQCAGCERGLRRGKKWWRNFNRSSKVSRTGEKKILSKRPLCVFLSPTLPMKLL